MATPVTACLDFYLFPDDFALPPSFGLGGIFTFKLLGAGSLLVNVTDAPGGIYAPVPAQGMRFPPPGVEIVPAVKRARATLSLGTFAGPVDVKALNAAGAVLQQVTVPGNNTYNTVKIHTNKRFDKLVLTGGGNEATLQQVCIPI
jgi:hypothetical protein